MRIRKYDFNYGRRALMQKAAVGASAGVLTPLWPLIAEGKDIKKAYPDELVSIEVYSKGKIKPGDLLTPDTVEYVKDLLAPITFKEIKTDGRRVFIAPEVKDVSELMPYQYLQATLKNKGKAVMGPDKNVWYEKVGTPWKGGNPYPDAKNGLEAMYNITLAWGRHDYSQYAIKGQSMGPSGEVDFKHDYVWAELNTTARPDGTVFHGKTDLLRYQSVWFTSPQNAAGTSFLSTWSYDQRKFPDLIGYLPAFRRVRTYPTNQRFEPLLPGLTFFLSNAWAAGDPVLTWGDYKIVKRMPMLGGHSHKNFWGKSKNWEGPINGGPKGHTYYDTYFSLIPENIVMDTKPTGYPRAPVGSRRIWFDVRSGMFVTMIDYDRRGNMWKSFEPGFGQYSNDGVTLIDPSDKKPIWSWCYVHSHDIQANRMTLIKHVEQCAGGYKSLVAANGVDVYNKYLTTQAIQRLGQV